MEMPVAALWSDYDLGTPGECRLIADGFNSHFLISTTTGHYVLRVYRDGWRTADDIAYELAVLLHLRGCGVPVCAPIVRRDGTFQSPLATPRRPLVAVVFDYAAGEAPDPTRSHVARSCGRTLAMIHAHTDHFTCEWKRFSLDCDHLILRPLEVILPLLAHRPSDCLFIQRIAANLHGGLRELMDGLEHGYCHGDFHGGNARVDTDGTLRVFDFDCGGLGWRAYDLSVCRLFCAEQDAWETFCNGYEEVRAIPATTRTAIPWFVVARQLWRMGLFAAHWSHLANRPADDAFFDEQIGILRDRVRKHLPHLAAEA